MSYQIVELRILPPLAIARFGSSLDPMDNYCLTLPDAIGPRDIVPAETIVVDRETGRAQKVLRSPVRFRDLRRRVRPVAPFFEAWVRFDGDNDLQPLTKSMIDKLPKGANAVSWHVHVANLKMFRRTADAGDRIEAETSFSDHAVHELLGSCPNFLDNPDGGRQTIPLGSVQYIKPSLDLPEIRLRFTPSAGRVYGPPAPSGANPNIRAVYDPKRGGWARYFEPQDPVYITKLPRKGQLLTIPAGTFASEGDLRDDNDNVVLVSDGYFDDVCDGIIEIKLETGAHPPLHAFARIATAVPSFAPDSFPVRTVADELEQALLGPEAASVSEEEVREIVRRALETVRLMNVAELNKNGMAAKDTKNFKRAQEPIFDPTVADSLAIQARHERALLALSSHSLAWFARALREYGKVGDLSTDGRRKMPGLMRGADSLHLALTRRQVSKVRTAANPTALTQPTTGVKNRIEAVNRTAQLQYRATGNPPSTLPHSAVSNAYPGLELDIRNLWKRILDGVELHEVTRFVISVRPDMPPAVQQLVDGYQLVKIDGVPITAVATGPRTISGSSLPLPLSDVALAFALESSNALAGVLRKWAGKEVEVDCEFQTVNPPTNPPAEPVQVKLRLRRVFDESGPVIARELAEPGDLTQSLCSPWQNDYRDCACFYWAASRPDFVNVEMGADGSVRGNNWMQKDRKPDTAKVYITDNPSDPRLLSYDDLFDNWEQPLRFIFKNQDEPE